MWIAVSTNYKISIKDIDTIYLHRSKIVPNQWQQCRSDDIKNVFQPVVLLQ